MCSMSPDAFMAFINSERVVTAIGNPAADISFPRAFLAACPTLRSALNFLQPDQVLSHPIFASTTEFLMKAACQILATGAISDDAILAEVMRLQAIVANAPPSLDSGGQPLIALPPTPKQTNSEVLSLYISLYMLGEDLGVGYEFGSALEPGFKSRIGEEARNLENVQISALFSIPLANTITKLHACVVDHCMKQYLLHSRAIKREDTRIPAFEFSDTLRDNASFARRLKSRAMVMLAASENYLGHELKRTFQDPITGLYFKA